MSDTPFHEDTQPFTPITPSGDEREPGGGCLLPAFIIGFLVTVLVIIGLFLPPVDLYNRLFGTQYAMLDAQNNAAAVDGLTLVVNPSDAGSQFGVSLASVPPAQFSAGGTASGPWVAEAQAAVPPSLALQSPVFRIETTGTAPGSVLLDIAAPTTANPDLLDLYAYDSESAQWRFIPSQRTADGKLNAAVTDLPDTLALFQAAPPSPVVSVAVDTVQTLSPEVAQLATIVQPAGLLPTLQGTVTGSLAAGFDLNAPYLVMPVIRNYVDPRALDVDTIGSILSNRSLRSEHVTQITQLASNNNYDGIVIDYRGLPADQRENFSAFIAELGASLDSLGLRLGVVVPSAENVAGAWETGAYDWRALGSAVDMLQINLPLDPAVYAPGADRLVEAMLRWAVGEVSRYKLHLGLSALSVRDAAGVYTTIGYDAALSGLGDVEIDTVTTDAGTVLPGTEISARLDGLNGSAGTEASVQAPYVDYTAADGTLAARLWLTTGGALRYRMDRTVPFALGGVAFNDLLTAGAAPDILESIFNYKVQLPGAPENFELALRWRIESASGVVDEVTTGLEAALVTTIEAPDGNYAINVAVVGGEVESPRSGVAVAVFAPTNTPTPVPTATPTPTPTAAPVVVAPVQPAQPAAPVSGPVSGPGAGSIVAGNFEYGGHINQLSDSTVNAMRRAGMTWFKVQIRYSAGMDPNVAAGWINDARSRGFKILIGTVGIPGELAGGGDGYIQQYASFLGGVAALGPDAIEVWNEPNIDREWPTGQISGAAYTNLLRQAYEQIKSRNSGVLVISGAPAPTGAEGAFPGQVVNDDRFVRDMVSSGALNYMDCLGAHYNEGIVGPSQRSGDPRDNYYTRYFGGMLDTYWNLAGGQKPICFTELGYLSSEGYPPLPDFFSWAQNVSVSQQASWLAEAAALSSQSGRVRLMIVWNVDFTLYGSDPQGGYAMIRPGGGCPACDALAAAR